MSHPTTPDPDLAAAAATGQSLGDASAERREGAERDQAERDQVEPPPSATPGEEEWQAAWETEENYWHENFSSRPYAVGPDYFERFRPAYRYGFDSARHSLGRSFEEAEPDLAQGWMTYEHRNVEPTAWEEIREAVRDAWHRVTGSRPAS